jgi:transcription initiation factor TFIID TATA-box-binding protein
VVNVVASTRISRPVDLDQIALALPNATFEREVFAGLLYRRKNPKSTIILFANGKFVSTGTTSERAARRVLRETLKEICQAEGRAAKIGPIRIVNVVGNAGLGGPLELSKVAQAFPEMTFEPEQFPGGVLHYPDHAAVLLFNSGQVICSGATSEKIARAHVEDVRLQLTRLGHLSS